MNKSLVLYFSRADENYFVGFIDKGNTEVIAEYISESVGADMFKVERKVPYAKDYATCIEESKEENNNGLRPELVSYLDNIDSYYTIYIGGPIYWGTLPAPMFTQLERLNWNGKNIRIFTTNEGSGLANVINDVKRVCVGANVDTNGLAIYGHDVRNSREKVEDWI